MKLQNVLKHIIILIALIILISVLTANILFTANISNDEGEVVTLSINNIWSLLLSIVIGLAIYLLGYLINKIDKKYIRVILFISVLIAYLVVQIVWINYRNIYPVADQKYVYEYAQDLYKGNDESLINSQYLELYPQQLTLVSLFNIFFKIFKTCNVKIIQYINAVANTLSIIAIYLITTKLDKEQTINAVIPLMLFCSFLTVPLLSTFVYGDEIGLTFALFSTYFVMEYNLKHKKTYLFISAILMSISCMFRMNNLIFVIAILIYLVLNILNKRYKIKENIKELVVKILLILLFIAIVIFPTTLIKNIMQNKYQLNKNNSFPIIGFLTIGITDGTRQAGWYNEYGGLAWQDVNTSKEKYVELLKERLQYFKTNPLYIAKFYAKKITSMWAENSFASVFYNTAYGNLIPEEYQDENQNEQIAKHENIIINIQKGIVLTIFITTAIVIFQKRQNLSNEILLLLIMFIGGFLFHIIWEAKSRYIISYIIMLMPIVGVHINKNIIKKRGCKKSPSKK